jgi:mono/diheme cytochrome c family protein
MSRNLPPNLSSSLFPKLLRKMSRQRFERTRLQAVPNRRAESKAALAAAFILLALAFPFHTQAQKSASASVTADLPPGAMQAKATTACLECHEARIILQQRLTKAAWAKEVDKMTKWGAVVDPADRDALIDYLSTNFSPDKLAYEPQRTSGSVKAAK